jgi:hypothetical protein
MSRRESSDRPILDTADLARGRGLRRSALGLVALVVSLTGCHATRTTDLDDLDLFLRFRVDGTLVEYTSWESVFAVFTSYYTGTEVMNVVAWDSTSGLRLRMSSGQAPNELGTYSIAHQVNDPTFRISIFYQDPGGIEYVASPVVPEDATIVISHVGPTTVGGTFFGIVKAADRPDVVITDGEFMVRTERDVEITRS